MPKKIQFNYKIIWSTKMLTNKNFKVGVTIRLLFSNIFSNSSSHHIYWWFTFRKYELSIFFTVSLLKNRISSNLFIIFFISISRLKSENQVWMLLSSWFFNIWREIHSAIFIFLPIAKKVVLSYQLRNLNICLSKSPIDNGLKNLW